MFGVVGDFLERGGGGVMVVGCSIGVVVVDMVHWFIVMASVWLGEASWYHELVVEVMNLIF